MAALITVTSNRPGFDGGSVKPGAIHLGLIAGTHERSGASLKIQWVGERPGHELFGSVRQLPAKARV